MDVTYDKGNRVEAIQCWIVDHKRGRPMAEVALAKSDQTRDVEPVLTYNMGTMNSGFEILTDAF